MPTVLSLTPRVLEGRSVRLEPVEAGHQEALRAVLASDREVWPLLPTCGIDEHFDGYWRALVKTAGRIAYVMRLVADGAVVGTTSLLDIESGHRSVQVGGTFLATAYRGTNVNPESKLLILEEAFEAGALRVHFAVDALNAASQAAVLKLGAVREGLLRKHRITWTGRVRDTVVFSILVEEWPQVRELLKRRLQPR